MSKDVKVGRCEARRAKPSRYLSNRNPSGWSYQKCGRKAVTKSQFGKLLCEKCSKVMIEEYKDQRQMTTKEKLEYAKTRLQGAKICKCQEDIETYTRHVKELHRQWRKEVNAEWQERHK